MHTYQESRPQTFDMSTEAHPEKMPSSASSTIEGGGVQAEKEGKVFSLWSHLNEEVDPKETTAPLAAYAFMTGYMCVARRYEMSHG